MNSAAKIQYFSENRERKTKKIPNAFRQKGFFILICFTVRKLSY